MGYGYLGSRCGYCMCAIGLVVWLLFIASVLPLFSILQQLLLICMVAVVKNTEQREYMVGTVPNPLLDVSCGGGS